MAPLNSQSVILRRESTWRAVVEREHDYENNRGVKTWEDLKKKGREPGKQASVSKAKRQQITAARVALAVSRRASSKYFALPKRMLICKDVFRSSIRDV